jgi:protein-disulfide isomerase
MTTETKVLTLVGLLTIIIIVGGAFLFSRSSEPTPVDVERLVRSHSPQEGSAAAPLTLVEFADFQCPSCAATNPVLKQLKVDYGEELNFVFRHFPLETIHPQARLASLVAAAAGEQNKFWDMHDLLYERQAAWANNSAALEIFTGYAEELDLDVDRFKQAIDNEKFAADIEQDQADGQSLRIPGTPTFFINGSPFVGSPSYQNLKAALDAARQ